jgi:hypothetical protein
MKEQTYQNPELVLMFFEEDIITSSTILEDVQEQEDKSWNANPWED